MVTNGFYHKNFIEAWRNSKFLLSSLYCGFQDLFMCFGLLSGADLLGILSKILMI
jgi:hypothetical protein